MCAISGIIQPSSAREQSLALVGKMADAMAHRGPDDSGKWISPTGDCALSHRRLSIIDLSIDGHQPMLSADGRYALTFNGEIYNYLSLRAQLEG